MLRGILTILTLAALAATMAPPMSCAGPGRPCCCAPKPGDAHAGNIAGAKLFGSGCGCRPTEMASCSPDAVPAPAPEGTTLNTARAWSLLPLYSASPPVAAISTEPPAATANSSPPTAPSLAVLGSYRI